MNERICNREVYVKLEVTVSNSGFGRKLLEQLEIHAGAINQFVQGAFERSSKLFRIFCGAAHVLPENMSNLDSGIMAYNRRMDGTLKKIGERVWHLPPHPDPKQVQPRVDVVVGDKETVLIDAGNTPRVAKTVLSELERIGTPPVGKVIYTHHHWDHVFGGCEYGAEAIAHTRCQTQLEVEALKPWSSAFLTEEVARDPTLEGMASVLRQGVENWTDFRIIVPAVTFETDYEVQGDGYRLELRHVGGKHAADSVVVTLPEEKIMFLGDSFYPPPLRSGLPDESLDMEMLKKFLAEDCELYLDGHSEGGV